MECPIVIDLTRRRLVQLAALGTLLRRFYDFAQALPGPAPDPARSIHRLTASSLIAEPFSRLHGGAFSGPAVPESPDPLIQYRWNNLQSTDDLQIYNLSPVALFPEPVASFEPGTTNSIHQEPILVKGVGSIRFDFGVESAAWLEFDSPDLSGSVETSISEYNEPAIVNTGPPHRFKTAAPQRYGNTYRLELNPDLYEGVRFGWIHVRTFDRPWNITAVRAVCQVKPTNYRGSFSCSNPMLTRIWYTGAYVVKANACKNYFGALLMDRGDRISWTGDAHPAQAAALVSFGNWDFIRENLERSATTNNGIESYSLYWILSLLDYYQHTADRATLEKYIDHVNAFLDHAKSIYADPPISFYGWDERLGAGFETPNRPETKSAYRMLFIHASMEFAAALLTIHRDDLSKSHRDIALQKMEEARTSEQWYQRFGLHALADATNTGLLSPEEISAIFEQEFSNRLNRLSFSPFNQYFILQALARMNRYDEAILTLLDIWGGQILYGGTTFFETYAPSWNQCLEKNDAVPNCQSGYTSLAHAWGAGVTAWLSREVLGIKPTSPGFSTVDITPHLGRTLSSVSGSVPTPHGSIDFAFNQRSGRGSATIPPNIVARIGIPLSDRDLRKVICNGRVLWDGQSRNAQGVASTSADAHFLYLENLQPGHYNFSAAYSNHPPAFTPEPLLYPIPSAREDTTTRGNWPGVYGHDGYVLFDYDGPRNDRHALPAYITAVHSSSQKIGGALHEQVAVATNDPRAPAPNPTNTQPRNLGQLYTGDPVACQQTMTVDIEAPNDKTYQLALYVVDWDRGERRQAVALFDLKTLNRLAPVHMLRNFAEGKYLIYSCTGSVRVRIDQVRGRNAVLNAIFFDPALGREKEAIR